MKTTLLMLLFVAAASPALADPHRANRAEPAMTCETVRAYVSQVGVVSPINMRDASEIERAAAAVIRAQPRPPRDAVHKMATELENYGPPRFQGGVRAIRATLSRKGSTV